MFEDLPDEILLEICRYLHCSHVLYSFFDLNSRLNRTITSYSQHVWFRRASYCQLLHIYEYILPRIGSQILSLTIHPLHQSSFPGYFKSQLANLCPFLKNLTLTSWRSENLLELMLDNVKQMIYLEKLAIQELSCSSTTNDRTFLENILRIENGYLNKIIFDYDCDSFHLQDFFSLEYFHADHIRYLTIQLDSLTDLSILIHSIPEIIQLDVTIRDSSLESVSFTRILPCLKDFSLWCVHWYSHLTDLPVLLELAPSIERFSLTISTRDSDLIDGDKLRSILPSQLQQFHYSVCFHASECYEQLDLTRLLTSWQPIPIVYSICEEDKRIFLHTLPYSSSRLIIRSSLAKNIPRKDFSSMYSNINQIQVYTMKNLSDIFPILVQCRRVRELTLLTALDLTISHPTTGSIFLSNKHSNPLFFSLENSSKLPVQLPNLSRLDILTIEGIPLDLHHLKELLVAAVNLTVLVIDLDCLLRIVENDDQSLIIYVLLHRRILDLCIRIEGNNHQDDQQNKRSKITIEQIHLISRIFTKVRNLTIDYESSKEFIQTEMIQSVIHRFQELVIFHVYGVIPECIKEDQMRNWILTQNLPRIKSNHIFRIECSNKWLKLWL